MLLFPALKERKDFHLKALGTAAVGNFWFSFSTLRIVSTTILESLIIISRIIFHMLT